MLSDTLESRAHINCLYCFTILYDFFFLCFYDNFEVINFGKNVRKFPFIGKMTEIRGTSVNSIIMLIYQ